MKTPVRISLLICLVVTLASGCASHQGSGLTGEWNVFRPLDDIQSVQGMFNKVSDGETGFFSRNPNDYIDEYGVATGVPTKYRRGWVISPWAPSKGVVDVRYFEENEIVVCPFTGKPLRVPVDKNYKAVDIVN